MKKLLILLIWITIFVFGTIAQERGAEAGSPFGVDWDTARAIDCGKAYPKRSATDLTAIINGSKIVPDMQHSRTPWATATFEIYADPKGKNISYKFEKFGCYEGNEMGTDGHASGGTQKVKGQLKIVTGILRANIDGQNYTSVRVKSNNSWINACFVKYVVKGSILVPNSTTSRFSLSHFGHKDCN